MSGKRKYRRRPLAVSIRMRDQAGAGEIEFDTLDLSLGGAFLKSDLFFEIGDKFELEVTLGTAAPLTLEARVVRTSRDEDRPGMGIAFESMPDAVRNAIYEFLNT